MEQGPTDDDVREGEDENREDEEEDIDSEEEERRFQEERKRMELDVFNKFNGLCDGVLTGQAYVHEALQEFATMKDELLYHGLPSSLLVKVSLVSTRIFRSSSDLNTPLGELIRLVRQYAEPWERKADALKRLHDDYEKKKHQLNIALKKLELHQHEVERMEKERKIGNWEKLYSKFTSSRSHGRRWKFLIKTFKNRKEEGFEFLHSYLDDLEKQSDDERQRSRKVEVKTPSHHSSDEFKLSSSGSDNESVASSKSHHSSVASDTVHELPGSFQGRPMVDTEDKECWTHEMEYDDFLCIKVLRLDGRSLQRKTAIHINVRYSGLTRAVASATVLRLVDHDDKTEKSEPVSQSDNPAARFPIGEDGDMPDEGLLEFDLFDTEPSDENTERYAITHLQVAKLQEAVLPTLMLPPSGETEEEAYLMDDEPFTLPLITTRGGIVAGNLYFLAYHGRQERPKIQDRPAQTYSLNELVYNTSGVDLSVTTREAMLEYFSRTYRDQCDSPMPPRTPTPTEEMVTKSEMDQALEDMKLENEATAQDYNEKIHQLTDIVEELKMELSGAQDFILQQKQALDRTQSEPSHRRSTPQGSMSTVRSPPSTSHSRRPKSGVDPQDQILDMFSEKSSNFPIPPRTPNIRQPNSRSKKLIPNYTPLPKWGENLPPDFLSRLQLYTDNQQDNRKHLEDVVRGEIERNIELQMASQHRLAKSDSTLIPLDNDDVCLPAVFMPPRTGIVYNPKASKYFHPHGSGGDRLTQPPAVFQLPPLSHQTNMSLIDILGRVPYIGSATPAQPPANEMQLDMMMSSSDVNQSAFPPQSEPVEPIRVAECE